MFVRPLSFVVLTACVLTMVTAGFAEAQTAQTKPPATVKPAQLPAKPATPPAAKPVLPETAKPADPAAKPDAPATPAAGKLTLESLAGTWDGVAQTPNGDMPVHAVLALQDGKITGTIETQMGVLTITSATLTGEVFELGFDLQGSAGGLSGKVAGEKYEGSWTVGADSGPFAMARVPPTVIKK